VCSEGGLESVQSIDGELIILVIEMRLDLIPSHRTALNKITANTEVYLPNEDTMFQVKYMSG